MGKRQINHRAVFLDRDGVINRAFVRDGKPYPARNKNEFEILSGVSKACAMLKKEGYAIVVATNQPDVGRGTLLQRDVEEIHSLLCQQLPIDHIEVCYHPGRGLSNCDCRKPRPGMLLKSARDLDLDLKHSWMVGDRWSDVECGQAAGCRTILIGKGYNEISKVVPDFQVNNLQEAVTIILNLSKL
jgi:D-glycero-D-manno-heptose 1,7-bisphosphate phosphatase